MNPYQFSRTETLFQKNQSPQEKKMIVLLWTVSGLLAVVLAFLAYLLMNVGSVFWIAAAFLILLDLYAANRMSSRFYIEFEYSLKDHDFDVAKIVARSDRTELVSLDMRSVTELGRYRAGQSLPKAQSYAKTWIDEQSENLWYLVFENEDGSSGCLVLEPNEKVLRHMSHFIPRSVSKTLLDGYRNEDE